MLTREDLRRFLREMLKKEFPQMSRTSILKLAEDLEPILIKFSSISPGDHAGLGLGIRSLTDHVAEKHKVSKDKVSSVTFEVLKHFAFKIKVPPEEKSKNIVKFFLGCKPEDIEDYTVLVAFDDVVERFKKNLDRTSWKGKVLNGTYKGVKLSVIATGIGSPATAIYLETLARTRTKIVLRVGSAGGLQENIELDDLVIPYVAIRDEGTTLSYAPPKYPAVADFKMAEIAKKVCEELSYTHHIGLVVTTDAIFRENKNFINKWNRLGVLAVDMETAALYVVGARKGLRVLSILSISDSPFKHVPFYDVAAHDERKHPGFQNALKVALETIRKLHSMTEK